MCLLMMAKANGVLGVRPLDRLQSRNDSGTPAQALALVQTYLVAKTRWAPRNPLLQIRTVRKLS